MMRLITLPPGSDTLLHWFFCQPFAGFVLTHCAQVKSPVERINHRRGAPVPMIIVCKFQIRLFFLLRLGPAEKAIHKANGDILVCLFGIPLSSVGHYEPPVRTASVRYIYPHEILSHLVSNWLSVCSRVYVWRLSRWDYAMQLIPSHQMCTLDVYIGGYLTRLDIVFWALLSNRCVCVYLLGSEETRSFCLPSAV